MLDSVMGLAMAFGLLRRPRRSKLPRASPDPWLTPRTAPCPQPDSISPSQGGCLQIWALSACKYLLLGFDIRWHLILDIRGLAFDCVQGDLVSGIYYPDVIGPPAGY